MFGTLLRKKLTSNQFANIFINAIFTATDNGFELVCDLINTDPAFIVSPQLETEKIDHFQLIVLAGNYHLLNNYFEAQQLTDIKSEIISKLSKIYQLEEKKTETILNNYQGFIKRVNHPSKNMVYGISKAIFFKYRLCAFQDEYFKRMQTPNPLFLKRLDHLVENYIWDWDVFVKKYKV